MYNLLFCNLLLLSSFIATILVVMYKYYRIIVCNRYQATVSQGKINKLSILLCVPLLFYVPLCCPNGNYSETLNKKTVTLLSFGDNRKCGTSWLPL
jgi:hypothetical protein